MNQQEISYPSHDGRTTIHATVCLPDGPPKAVLQICHGMCEYFGRYLDFAAYMTQHGYIVCGNDHLGHGRSVGVGERLGHFGKSGGDRHLVEDAHTLLQKMRETYGLPVILMGHSMGSAVARHLTAACAGQLAGAVFSGTPIQKLPRLSALAIRTQIKKHGPDGTSPLLVNMSLGGFNKPFAHEGRENAWLSRDVAVVDAYNADPLCTFSFSTAAYRDLLRLVHGAAHKSWPRSLPPAFPVLVVSGDQDPCGDFGRGVRRVFAHMQRAGMTDVTLKLYPGARHEILNELNREEVFADILAWCDRVLSGGSAG